MYSSRQHIILLTAAAALLISQAPAQKLLPFRLPDTGQTGSYTATPGEDADFIINPPSLTDNRNGTITDNNTGLVWQKTDGGEMTWEAAAAYCASLALGGYHDWRLPTGRELFSINNYDNLNPALDTAFFTMTPAEYWWSGEKRADDSTKVWVVNAGGGIGAHPKTETVSAGGTKLFHVRAVRNPYGTSFAVSRFSDNGDGTVRDNYTGLTWQKLGSQDTMTWEDALSYSRTAALAGKSDWRLPNVREIQSLNDPGLLTPSFDTGVFPSVVTGNYWSSTSMYMTPSKAWDINTVYGIVSYSDKTRREYVLLVRGGLDNRDLNITEVGVPGGEYAMGDHYGFVDPGHPGDETPVHNVRVDGLWVGTTTATNQQFLAFLNSSLLQGSIELRGNVVYRTGDTAALYFTHQYASWYSIGYDGSVFAIADFRASHPVVGVMWCGAAAYCNWLSAQNGLQQCYSPGSWDCDFSRNGYRLPTEAEWEYAARGGQTNPYYKYPWGNDTDTSRANWPSSGDPYEGTGADAYPFTTPVGFYDGSLRLKSDFNWPGSALSYQTTGGANAFGLYDMAGNVWEFVNDWYQNTYYSVSPYDNPKGPVVDSASVMPDGKRYRGMRGGNWYNGDIINSVNDGHSRVSNRNPSYYRGPQDPNHPWYHVGFRVVRAPGPLGGVHAGVDALPEDYRLFQNYPNPFNPSTTVRYSVPRSSRVRISVFNTLGQEVARLVDGVTGPGVFEAVWEGRGCASGVYFCTMSAGSGRHTIKMIQLR